jgi:cytochrome c peroxidase
VFETESRARLATLPVGRAPQGLAFDASGSRLFVQDFLSRAVTVYDTSALVTGESYNPPRLADVPVVASETLAPSVLRGKQIFYDASDRRMNLDGYISCASCHLDGGADAQVWDFTQVGEGLRNTIPLAGRAGTGHGNVHWTANFDEIQDFENDVRAGFSGAGFLLDADFAATEDPLGAPKAGLSADLDALSAFVSSLDAFPPSPFRAADGGLTPLGLQGQALFAGLGCAACHPPPDYTDSLRHDVGTIRPSSGLGIGQPLTGVGFETPTLRGLWLSAPYLHDGSARTLADVLARPGHGGAHALSPDERRALASYLLQIE